MTEEEKEKIMNAFNNAWNKKIASENSYGKLASKEMFENKEEIKTEISTDCSYYKDVMTEEIIIDGVNVAGCYYFSNCITNLMCQDSREVDEECKYNPNCYYKQLQRLKEKCFAVEQESIQKSQTICGLKQENEDLRERLSEVQNTYLETREVAKNFSEENEKLKDNNNHLQAIIDDGRAENKRFREENKELKTKLDVFAFTISQYESALEEINITVKQLLQGVSSNCINNTPYLTALSLIENKINEVLNNES